MSLLLTLVIVLVIFALAFYLVDLLPGDAKLRQIIKALLIVIALLYLLGLLFGQMPAIRLP